MTLTLPRAVPQADAGRGVILLLALTCGVAVGNVYFPQAITPSIASGLGVSPDGAALVVTATQFGYAAGIFLLVPLGDRVPHRRLVVALLALTGLGLLAAGAAPGVTPLAAASALVGAVTVIAPILGPMAAGMVAPDRRGTVSGILLGGSIGGMLLSRTLGGLVGGSLGWRAPYLAAAVLTLVSALVLSRSLPRTEPASRERYPALIAAPLRLLRTEPDLRRSCFYQAALFGGFSAAWTGVALLLTGPAYGLTTRAVGLLALVNAATMFCTPLAGRVADRRGPDLVNRVSMLAVAASALVLVAGARGGTPGLAALVAGFLVLDVAMQSGMVANQVRIYALGDSERSRLNTAYMTCAYLGGSLGSWLGAHAYARFGWRGVCALVAVLAVLALGKAARSSGGIQQRSGSQGT